MLGESKSCRTQGETVHWSVRPSTGKGQDLSLGGLDLILGGHDLGPQGESPGVRDKYLGLRLARIWSRRPGYRSLRLESGSQRP